MDECVPAVGQGALGIECREDDVELLEELRKLSDQDTWDAVHAERAFLAAMDGGCQVPIAGHAVINGDEITMTGLVAAPDASVFYKEVVVSKNAEEAGKEAARLITEQGAYDLIQQVKADLNV